MKRIINLNYLYFLLPLFLITLIFFKIIFKDQFFLNGDSLYGFYAYYKYFVQGGSIITQNILSGFPVFTSNTGTWFYPINNIFNFLFGSIKGYVYLNILNIALAYIFSFLFIHKISKSTLLSILGSMIFVFCGQAMLWSETLGNTNYYYILPLVFYLNEIINTFSGYKKYILIFITGLVLGASWLSGHVQYVFYIHTFFFIFILFNKYSGDIRERISKIISISFVSFVIGFEQIYAILSFRDVTHREYGVSLDSVFSGSYGIHDLLHFILPFINFPYFSWSNPNLYIGIIPLILLITAIFSFNSLKEQRYFTFFYVSFLFCLLFSFKNSPLALLVHNLPLFNSFREAPRIMFLGSFSLSILCVYVLNYILNYFKNGAPASDDQVITTLKKVNNIYRKVFYFVFLPIILFITLIFYYFKDKIFEYSSIYFLSNVYNTSLLLPKEHYLNIINSYVSSIADFTFFDYQIIVFSVFSVFAIVFVNRIGSIKIENILKIFIVIQVLNIAFVYYNHFKSIPISYIETEPNTVTFIKNDNKSNSPYRVASILPGFGMYEKHYVQCDSRDESDSFFLKKELLQPNMNMLYGIDIIDGYDNFMPRNISEVLGSIGSEQSLSQDVLANRKMSMDDKLNEILNNLDKYKMMNTKYLLSLYILNNKDLNLVYKEKVSKCNIEVYLYEVKGYWPRYFFTKDIKENISENNVKDMIEIIPKYDKYSTSLIFNTDYSGKVFLGNTYMPRYKINLDGKDIEPKIYKNLYMYFEVDKGSHKIDINYPIYDYSNKFLNTY
jgi:hypothetical protein